MTAAPGNQSLRRWEKVLLALALAGLIVFAGLAEMRSAFLKERHTDFNVYSRAAWAAKVGLDMYKITDDHGWHYCYPPPFALLLIPFADPPTGIDRTGFMPFWVAALLWILFSLALALWTVHAMAKALLPDAVPWTRRWVYARSIPFTVCSGAIGFTVSHGQVNTAVAALLAGMFVAVAAGRRFKAGAWLAGAAALKITPGLLVLYPLVRRDARTLAGLGVTAVAVLFLFPAAFFGFQGAIDENMKVVSQVLTPAATGGGDQTRAEELTNTLATDSSSFVAVIHNWRNPQKGWERPRNAERSTRLAHWAIAGTMIGLTALLMYRRRNAEPIDQVLLLGGLVLVMILTSPVSHNHHFAMALPAVCALWLKGLRNHPGQFFPKRGVVVPLAVWMTGTAVLLFPGPLFLMLREFGLGTAVTVLLWGCCLFAATRKAIPAVEVKPEPLPRLRAA